MCRSAVTIKWNFSFRNSLVSTPDSPTRNEQETTNIGKRKWRHWTRTWKQNRKAPFPGAAFSSAAVGSAAKDALVQMDLFLRACAAISAALLSRSWRCQPRVNGSARLAAAVLCRFWTTVPFGRSAVSRAALSGKLLYCHLIRNFIKKKVQAVSCWFIRHGIIYCCNRAAASHSALTATNKKNLRVKHIVQEMCWKLF